MAELGVDIDEIGKLVRLVEDSNLDELIVEEAGVKVIIRGLGFNRKSSSARLINEPPQEWIDLTPDRHPISVAGSDVAEEVLTIASPMIGVFYRAPGADAPPFIEVGDHVEVGQTIGLMEAMKVFSEIPSDYSGTVVEIVAHNGQLVHSGDPLVLLRPDPV